MLKHSIADVLDSTSFKGFLAISFLCFSVIQLKVKKFSYKYVYSRVVVCPLFVTYSWQQVILLYRIGRDIKRKKRIFSNQILKV